MFEFQVGYSKIKIEPEFFLICISHVTLGKIKKKQKIKVIKNAICNCQFLCITSLNHIYNTQPEI